MNSHLLKLLPYILPTQNINCPDEYLSVTSKHFKALYGDIILETLRQIGFVKPSQQFISGDQLPDIVDNIRACIDVSKQFSFWKNNGNHVLFPGLKMKKEDIKIYTEQRQQGEMIPGEFLIEQKLPIGSRDKCWVGYIFQSLLILFDYLLTQVRSINQDANFKHNVSRLFNIAAYSSQVYKFVFCFVNAKKYKKGAIKTRELKNTPKKNVQKIVQNLGLKHRDTIQKNLPETISRIKIAYKKQANKKFPYNYKTLENYVIDAIK